MDRDSLNAFISFSLILRARLRKLVGATELPGNQLPSRQPVHYLHNVHQQRCRARASARRIVHTAALLQPDALSQAGHDHQLPVADICLHRFDAQHHRPAECPSSRFAWGEFAQSGDYRPHRHWDQRCAVGRGHRSQRFVHRHREPGSHNQEFPDHAGRPEPHFHPGGRLQR